MLSLAIDNTNTPNRAPRSGIGTKVRSEALRSSDAGNVPDFTSAPAESASDAISATHSNSRVSSRADMAGEAYPSQTRTSPAIPFNSTGATVEAETIASQAVSAIHSTWSPWSVCKGSI